MGNYNERELFNEPSTTTEPVHVVFFVSRNKDNSNLPNFKQRKHTFLTTFSTNSQKLNNLFEQFVNQGVTHELSRFYVSINPRDNKKTQTALMHYLLDHENINMANLNAILAKLAMSKSFATEKNRMFDFDLTSREKVDEFVNDLVQRGANKETIEVGKTLHGYYVVIQRGVDLRKLVDTMTDAPLSQKKDKGPWKWSKDEVTYKFDELKLVKWKTK
jgi:hypothetical protein